MTMAPPLEVKCICGRVVAVLKGVSPQGELVLPKCKQCKRVPVVDLTRLR